MPSPRVPATCFVPTPDHWALALYRYRAASPTAPAVILCGGYACNRHFVDFDERYSLARYLAERGFDSWVVELRGRGHSHPLPGCRRPHSWTFDDLARIDVPTVIRFVRGQVGHDCVGWIGHSLGGMVVYAHLGLAEADATPAVIVAMGSPVAFPRHPWELVHRLGGVLLAFPFPGRVPQRIVLGALWQVLGRTRQIDIGMNPDNVDRAVVGTALRRSLTDVPRAKLQQLAHWADSGVFASVDGSIDYRANLRRVRVPALVVAGTADRLAPPEAAGVAYDLMPTRGKRFVEVGRSSGFSIDYGHVDLIFGRRAPDEVFPVIAAWVREALGG